MRPPDRSCGHRDDIDRHAVAGFIIVVHAARDRHIVSRRNRERPAPAIVGHLAVSNDEIAILENERSRAEHFRLIGLLGINGNVGDSAGPKMSAIREPKELGGSGTGHRGDLVERIFASDR